MIFSLILWEKIFFFFGDGWSSDSDRVCFASQSMLFGYRICMQNLQQCGSGSCQIKTRFYKACKFVSSIPECICKAIAAPKHRLGALTHILNGLYFLRTVLRLGGRLFELARTVEQPGTPQHDGYGAHGGGEAEMTRMTEASSSLRSR